MKLIENKKYSVHLEFSIYRDPCTYKLYFREILLNNNGSPIFKFSEDLRDDSIYYNFFPAEELFTIHDCR